MGKKRRGSFPQKTGVYHPRGSENPMLPGSSEDESSVGANSGGYVNKRRGPKSLRKPSCLSNRPPENSTISTDCNGNVE